MLMQGFDIISYTVRRLVAFVDKSMRKVGNYYYDNKWEEKLGGYVTHVPR